MSSVLDTAMNLRSVTEIEEPEKKTRGRKPGSKNKASGANGKSVSKSTTAKNRKSRKSEVADTEPKKELFSYEEKKAYCDAKYGVGNWYFMSKDELRECFRIEVEKRKIREELENERKRSSK